MSMTRKWSAGFAAYIKKYKVSAVFAVFAMIISTLTTLFMPLLFADAINIVQTSNAADVDFIIRYFLRVFSVQGNLNILTLIFVVFIVDSLICWGSQYIQQYTMANIGYGMIRTLRRQMFDHLQKLSLAFYDRNEVGRIMSRILNDVGSLENLLSNGLLLVFADLITLGWHCHYFDGHESGIGANYHDRHSDFSRGDDYLAKIFPHRFPQSPDGDFDC